MNSLYPQSDLSLYRMVASSFVFHRVVLLLITCYLYPEGGGHLIICIRRQDDS